MTLRDFIDQRYWPTYQPGLCLAWQVNTERYLTYIKADLGHLELDAINTETLDAWNIQLRRKYQTPVTPNKTLSRLRHIFQAAVRWKALRDNPALYLTQVQEPVHKFRPLDPVERAQLLHAASPRLHAYIFWGQYTGARLGSLAKLLERHVDLRRDVILFEKTKNGEDFTIPLHPELKKWCEAHFTGVGTRRALPQYKDHAIVSRSFYELTHRLHIRGFRFHDLRHEVGSSLAAAGAHPKVIMAMLGHKDIKMSMRYTHPQAAEVRNMMLLALFPNPEPVL